MSFNINNNAFNINNIVLDESLNNTLYYLNTNNLLNGTGPTGPSNITPVTLRQSTVSDAYNNTNLGNASLSSVTSDGLGNTAIGSFSLTSNTFADYNTALGYNTLYTNVSGYFNTSIGAYSLYSNLNGVNNTSIGYDSMRENISGVQNTAIGVGSLNGNTVDNNTAIGFYSLVSNTVGAQNTAIGSSALGANISGNDNTSIGYNSMGLNDTGKQNTVIGSGALSNNTSGENNVVIGYISGTTLTTGNNNIIIGFNTQPSSNNVNNEITLGNNTIATLRCNQTSITSLSDKRDKTSIQDLGSCLPIIDKLKPITFKWDKREWYPNGISDGSKIDNNINIGFLAQDLKKLQEENNVEYFNLVYESDSNKLEATSGNLLIPLIKAVQELSYKVKILENKINK